MDGGLPEAGSRTSPKLVALSAVVLAASDWVIKGAVVLSGLPFVFHDPERSLAVVVGSVALAIITWVLVTDARSDTLAARGAAMVLGGTVGNAGEAIVLGHVTDFIPLLSGYLASPGDLIMVAGYGVVLTGVSRSLWRAAG